MSFLTYKHLETGTMLCQFWFYNLETIKQCFVNLDQYTSRNCQTMLIVPLPPITKNTHHGHMAQKPVYLCETTTFYKCNHNFKTNVSCRAHKNVINLKQIQQYLLHNPRLKILHIHGIPKLTSLHVYDNPRLKIMNICWCHKLKKNDLHDYTARPPRNLKYKLPQFTDMSTWRIDDWKKTINMLYG